MLYLLKGEKSNNILEVNPKGKIGSSIYNWVKVRAGNLDDHWTEETAQYLTVANPGGGSAGLLISDDYSVFAAGKASIKATCTTSQGFNDAMNNTYGPQICFNFPLFNCEYLDYSNISYENCSVYLSHNQAVTGGSDTGKFFIIITDDSGRKMRWKTENINRNEWKKIEFVLGYNAPTPGKFTYKHPDRMWESINGTGPETSFNWGKIVSIAFELHPNGLLTYTVSCDFWVDGLTFPSSDAVEIYAVAEDKTSQQVRRKRMISIYRPDLKSQNDVQYVADEEARTRKDPFDKYSLLCDFQPNLLYAGLLCYVLAPDYHIGAGVTPELGRILSIRHLFIPGVPGTRGFDAFTYVEVVRHNGGQNVNAAKLRQAGNPQNAINMGHEARLLTLEDKSGGGSGGSGGGGGGGSASWNGGDVTEEIVLKSDWPVLDETKNEVYMWLWNNPGDIHDKHKPCLKFSDNKTGNWTDVYGLGLSNGQDVGPTIGVGYNLLVRGDIVLRGIVRNFEGGHIMTGGYNMDGTTKKCGWARSANPFIWLNEGGTNPNANTLELYNNLSAVNGNPSGWSHIHCNGGSFEGFVATNYLSSLSGNSNIWLSDHLVPYDNETTDLGNMYYRYRDIYGRHGNFGDVYAPLGLTTQDIYSPTNGKSLFNYTSSGDKITLNANVVITGTLTADMPSANPFNQNLNTYNAVTFNDITNTGSMTVYGSVVIREVLECTHLRAWPWNYSIALYSSLIPASGNITVGTLNNPFYHMYAKEYTFTGCERINSGKEWIQKIQNETDALEVLTEQVTKTVYHTTYNNETNNKGELVHPDEIICICGKSVKQPCPEHLEAYSQKYSKSLNKQVEATSHLTLLHAGDIAQLRVALDYANERIVQLEKMLRDEVKTA
jgi:hypothetical protein